MIRYGWLAAVCLAAVGCSTMQPKITGVPMKSMQSWEIVVSPDAIPSERYAAEEFQNVFEQSTGIRLPITEESSGKNRKVFIGHSNAMRASSVGFEIDDFGPEDLRVVVNSDGIAIAGGRPRGTLYGVYTFLEECMGVRFLTPDHTHVPRHKNLVLQPVDKTYRPPLEFRFCYFGEIREDHVFATRMRTNTVATDPRLGGKAPQQLINHSVSRYVPWRQYGQTNPEYFNEIDGRRPTETLNDHFNPGIQPCMTNSDVVDLMVSGVLRDLERDPNRANISVSQNDNRHHCRCASCREIDEAAQSNMGSLLTLVNTVADAVAEKHPDVKVGTLAYQYSRKPPVGMRPRPNVQIQLASIECCQIHPIDDPNCPLNTGFCEDLSGWRDLTENIYIWTYVTNFLNYLAPCPNIQTLGPNIRFFVENNAKGLFMQGPSSGAELAGLRTYIISNLIWDPTRNENQLIDEFLTLHYGSGAQAVRQYINIMREAAESSGKHQHCFGATHQYGITPDVAREALAILEDAMAAADDSTIRDRVEKVTIPCYLVLVEPATFTAYRKAAHRRWGRDDGTPFVYNDPEAATAARKYLPRFIELCRKHGIVMPGEKANIDELIAVMREGFGMNKEEEF